MAEQHIKRILVTLILSLIFYVIFLSPSVDKGPTIAFNYKTGEKLESDRQKLDKYFRIFDDKFKSKETGALQGEDAASDRGTNEEGILEDFEEETQEKDKRKSRDSPKVILLWSTWRSGTHFIGDLLSNAMPDTFYSVEPLHYWKVNILHKNETRASNAKRYLQDLLHCRIHPKYKTQIAYMSRQLFYTQRNTYLMKWCRPVQACDNPSFVGEACKKAKLHVGKIIRLPLRDAWPLLNDEKLDIHIFYLARDPRAVLASRLRVSWCNDPTCGDPDTVCELLQEDLETAESLQEEFPKRFKLIQYEEFCQDAKKGLNNLMSFVGLPVTKEQLEVLNPKITKPEDLWSTKKNASLMVDRWRTKNNFKNIELFQESCTIPLSMMGLRSINSKEELKNLSLPLLMSDSAK